NGKIELETNQIVAIYKETQLRNAYFVSSKGNDAFSITKAIAIDPWIFKAYSWGTDYYTLAEDSGYTDTNMIAKKATDVTVSASGVNPVEKERVIKIDGVNYLYDGTNGSLNSTLSGQIFETPTSVTNIGIGTKFKVLPNAGVPSNSPLSELILNATAGGTLDISISTDFSSPFTITSASGTITLSGQANSTNLMLSGNFEFVNSFSAGNKTITGTTTFIGGPPSDGKTITTDANSKLTITPAIIITGSSRFTYDNTNAIYNFEQVPSSEISVPNSASFMLTNGLQLNAGSGSTLKLYNTGLAGPTAAASITTARISIVGTAIQFVTLPSDSVTYNTNASFILPTGNFNGLQFKPGDGSVKATIQRMSQYTPVDLNGYSDTIAGDLPVLPYNFYLRLGNGKTGYKITSSGTALEFDGNNLEASGATFTILSDSNIPIPPPPEESPLSGP
ncbi:MAG: hypothetical protein LBN97_04055, partial [Oscillospiraceae bacterium]|nr:hypothetical protein [Oscillospiraceae bacterium]